MDWKWFLWGVFCSGVLFILLAIVAEEMKARRKRRGMEDVMTKADFGTQVDVPEFGAAGGRVTASMEEGVEGNVDVTLKPNTGAAISGVAGAAAYSWLLGLAGPWTAPMLIALGAGVWFYRRQQAKKNL